MADVAHLAAMADTAGFDAQWSYEVLRNPLLVAAAAAMATERSRVGTGIIGAFARSPFDLANSALDLDDMSRGRMTLGIGTGAPEALRAFHNSNGDAPIARMREYIDVLRRSWDYLATGHGRRFEGEHFRFSPPPVNPWGERELIRPQVPVYLAAMGPQMIRLCGSRADGWIGYFYTPELLDSFVRTNLEKGAAKAGRTKADVEICVEMVCSISTDRRLAFARARRQVGFYAVHPITNALLAGYGLLDEVEDLRARFKVEGPEAFAHTSDRLVDKLSITGTPEEARHKLQEYHGHVDLMLLHTPYVPPLTMQDATDAFSGIVETLAPDKTDSLRH
ncbi:MAG: LLM class flavin-dependent oxidoreductase [Mycobacterium sp.]|nr:MAG: LLM class flavin-dependent oxidoreductase [Mycobacterium sp.]